METENLILRKAVFEDWPAIYGDVLEYYEKECGEQMYGAIIGDIVGSQYEFGNIKRKDFQLFSAGCCFTDDTVITVAVGKALLTGGGFVEQMQAFGRRHPFAGYGGKFMGWLMTEDPQPYGSWGNGSAMRVSPCGLAASSLEEALDLAERSAAVSHDHPAGIMGAQAVAAAVYMAKSGSSKDEIREYVRAHFYPLDQTLDRIRPGYQFDASCQGSVPQAIQAFLESVDFEDAIRNAVSIGGDSDTIAAITGSIAWPFYSREAGPTEPMQEIWRKAAAYLTDDLLCAVREFTQHIDTSKGPVLKY